jgi:hypothetical protein
MFAPVFRDQLLVNRPTVKNRISFHNQTLIQIAFTDFQGTEIAA